MKAAFEEWRHWLEGATHQFTVLTDHKNLEYLRTVKRLNPRQARWSLFFTRFNFVVTYRPGSKNTKGDVLSRQSDSDLTPQLPETILAPGLVVAPIQWDIMTEIEQANSQSEVPSVCPPNKVYVPEAFRNRVLELVHSLPSSGHPGITATIQLLQNRFWWSSLSRDTTTFVRQCKCTCNTQKSSRQLPAGLLQPLPVPQRPWSHIALFPYPNSLSPSRPQNNYATWSSDSTGYPQFRGPQFTSRVWSAFFKTLNVNVSLTSGYHPQSNGQVERLNQEIIRFLRSYCQQHQNEWSRYLMWDEYAQNSIQKRST